MPSSISSSYEQEPEFLKAVPALVNQNPKPQIFICPQHFVWNRNQADPIIVLGFLNEDEDIYTDTHTHFVTLQAFSIDMLNIKAESHIKGKSEIFV